MAEFTSRWFVGPDSTEVTADSTDKSPSVSFVSDAKASEEPDDVIARREGWSMEAAVEYLEKLSPAELATYAAAVRFDLAALRFVQAGGAP